MPPKNVSLPTVSGTAAEGQTLTAANGSWTSLTPITFTYQWQRCTVSICNDFAGATGRTYAVTASDVGKTLRVRVRAANPAGSSEATSLPTTVVGLPINTSPPMVSRLGQTLTATTGAWTGSLPMTFTYQWQRRDATGSIWNNITGATGQTYMLTASDIGKTLRVRVSAANAAGSSEATSLPVSV